MVGAGGMTVHHEVRGSDDVLGKICTGQHEESRGTDPKPIREWVGSVERLTEWLWAERHVAIGEVRQEWSMVPGGHLAGQLDLKVGAVEE